MQAQSVVQGHKSQDIPDLLISQGDIQNSAAAFIPNLYGIAVWS